MRLLVVLVLLLIVVVVVWHACCCCCCWPACGLAFNSFHFINSLLRNKLAQPRSMHMPHASSFSLSLHSSLILFRSAHVCVCRFRRLAHFAFRGWLTDSLTHSLSQSLSRLQLWLLPSRSSARLGLPFYSLFELS